MKPRKYKGTPGKWTLRLMADGKPFIEAPKVNPTAGYNIEIFGEDAGYPEEMRNADMVLGSYAKEMFELLCEFEEKFRGDVEYSKVKTLLDLASRDISKEQQDKRNQLEQERQNREDGYKKLLNQI